MNNDNNNNNKDVYEVGKTYVFFVPPGWLLAGTVTEVRDKHLILSDSVHLESISQGSNMIGDVASATTPKRLQEVVTSSYAWRDGSVIHKEAVLIASPCEIDMKALARKREGDAVKRAGGR